MGLEYDDRSCWISAGGHAGFVADDVHDDYGQLFATAPELLEALKAALTWYGDESKWMGPTDWPAMARGAIAKAKGLTK